MYYKGFTIVGVANETTADAGLVSLVDKPVRIRAILINVDTHEGSILEGWIGTDRILEIYDYVLDTQALAGADTPPLSAMKLIRIPIEEDLKPGQIFKIAINCGAAANDVFGSYEYEPVS